MEGMGVHPQRPTRISLRVARSSAQWRALWDWLLAPVPALPNVPEETPSADVEADENHGKGGVEDPEDFRFGPPQGR